MKIIISILILTSFIGCKTEDSSTPKSLQDTTSTSDLANCKTYFDGCNTCFVENGKITGCTEMYCEPEAYEESRCTQYK